MKETIPQATGRGPLAERVLDCLTATAIGLALTVGALAYFDVLCK